MRTFLFILLACFAFGQSYAQLPLVRDTLTVIENGYALKMPWGNGFNSVNVSSVDLNRDGKKDLVLFDRFNTNSEGRFRCFINTGNTSNKMYRADTYLSYLLPRAYNWAVFVDYNKDGLEDLFTSGNSDITVYKNTTQPNGWPSFTLVKSPILVNNGTSSNPNYSPLFSSVVGVPGISDVDSDGDLDIVNFSALGYTVRLSKNLSREKGYLSDSLEFVIDDDCWGNLSEGSCSVDFNNCKSSHSVTPQISAKELHAGSCITCLDSDGDQDIDLVMGDVSCNYVEYVHNGGSSVTAVFNDSTKLYPNFKSNNTSVIRMNSFPCTYYVDADNDGKTDLLASPNTTSGENFKSLWFYKNTSNTSTVNFQYVKNNYLQDEMIDVGQNSYPVVFDYDADNKKDLLIGTYGYYIGNTLRARLTLYRNVGTTTQPSYSLVSRDYAGLSTQTNVSFAIPTVGDVDGDLDQDILIGTSYGQVHWLENTAGPNVTCNFSVYKSNPFNFTTGSAIAAPQLFDLDGDAKLDLLIGGKNGRIAYYRNIGTTTAPAYTLITNTLGSVDTKDDPNIYGYDGYAVPYFYRESGVTKLLVGSVTGKIFQYLVPSNPLAPFTLINSTVNNINEGGQSSVCYEDVNGDSKPDLFVGNASGGLCFYTSNSPFLSVKELTSEILNGAITLFPNPVSQVFQMNVNGIEVEGGSVEIKDLSGRLVCFSELKQGQMSYDLSDVEKGIYFVTIEIFAGNQKGSITKKIIKE